MLCCVIVFNIVLLCYCIVVRYLPQELLNSSDRHYSADIFSLGLTLYELCCTPDLDVLPYSGELWHDLREGRGAPLGGGRSQTLVHVIAAGEGLLSCAVVWCGVMGWDVV